MKKSLLASLAFWQTNKTDIELGIYVCPDKLVIARAEVVGDAGSGNHMISEIPFDGTNWTKAFMLLEKQFESARVQLTLNPIYYQVLMVDRPNVEEDEMAQALLWSIKDLINDPVDQVHIDFYESLQAGGAKLNVVVVNKASFSALAVAAKAHHIQIAGINTEELALSNLFADKQQARLALSHIEGQELLLTVIRQGELCMQRRVRGFNQITNVSEEELAAGIADNLSLELQRSMDYFESQLRQAPVTSIDLLLKGKVHKLAELVSANFNQKVNIIETESIEAKMASLALNEMHRSEEAVSEGEQA